MTGVSSAELLYPHLVQGLSQYRKYAHGISRFYCSDALSTLVQPDWASYGALDRVWPDRPALLEKKWGRVEDGQRNSQLVKYCTADVVPIATSTCVCNACHQEAAKCGQLPDRWNGLLRAGTAIHSSSKKERSWIWERRLPALSATPVETGLCQMSRILRHGHSLEH